MKETPVIDGPYVVIHHNQRWANFTYFNESAKGSALSVDGAYSCK
jgi:hypothetical protein